MKILGLLLLIGLVGFIFLSVYANLRQEGKLDFLIKRKKEYIEPDEEDFGFIDREDREIKSEDMKGSYDSSEEFSIFRDDINKCLRDIQIGMPLDIVVDMLHNNPNLTDFYVIEEGLSNKGGLNSVREWYIKGTKMGFQLIVKNGRVVNKRIIK